MQDAVNLGELIIAALGILSIVITSWIHVRVEIAKINQRMVSMERDLMREQNTNAANSDKLWTEVSGMRKEVQQILIKMESKADKE